MQRVLELLFADVHAIKLDMDRVASGVVARDAETLGMRQTVGRVEATLTLLKLWTQQTDKRLDAQHDVQIRGLLEAIAERKADERDRDVEVSVPVGDGRLRFSASGAVIVRLVMMVGTAVAAWAVGAAHAAQHVIEQVSR